MLQQEIKKIVDGYKGNYNIEHYAKSVIFSKEKYLPFYSYKVFISLRPEAENYALALKEIAPILIDKGYEFQFLPFPNSIDYHYKKELVIYFDKSIDPDKLLGDLQEIYLALKNSDVKTGDLPSYVLPLKFYDSNGKPYMSLGGKSDLKNGLVDIDGKTTIYDLSKFTVIESVMLSDKQFAIKIIEKLCNEEIFKGKLI